MKRIAVATVGLVISTMAYGQGTLLFDTRVPGLVDARFVYPDNITGFGAGWTAQLFGGPEAAGFPLSPLFPTTTFKTSSQADLGYVNPVVVTVPGVVAGAKALVQMRAIFDADPRCVVSGDFISVTLGGGTLPAAHLGGDGMDNGRCHLYS